MLSVSRYVFVLSTELDSYIDTKTFSRPTARQLGPRQIYIGTWARTTEVHKVDAADGRTVEYQPLQLLGPPTEDLLVVVEICADEVFLDR